MRALLLWTSSCSNLWRVSPRSGERRLHSLDRLYIAGVSRESPQHEQWLSVSRVKWCNSYDFGDDNIDYRIVQSISLTTCRNSSTRIMQNPRTSTLHQARKINSDTQTLVSESPSTNHIDSGLALLSASSPLESVDAIILLMHTRVYVKEFVQMRTCYWVWSQSSPRLTCDIDYHRLWVSSGDSSMPLQ